MRNSKLSINKIIADCMCPDYITGQNSININHF
jgi:hypothetical protein